MSIKDLKLVNHNLIRLWVILNQVKNKVLIYNLGVVELVNVDILLNLQSLVMLLMI